jgi:hypothetical protein
MEEIAGTPTETKMVQPLEPKKERKLPPFLIPLLVILGIVLAGTVSGYFLAGRGGGGMGLSSPSQLAPGTELKGQEFGSKDASAFPDTATGVLEKGGIDGEGTHKLIREGGESQTAYLTSSLVDLDPLVGKKVQVWGETFKGQKAGWLMDVGRVKVLE